MLLNIIDAVLVFLSYMFMAEALFIIGPFVFDMMARNSEPMSKTVILHVSQGVGMIIGSAVTLVTVHYVDKFLNLTIALTIGSLSFAVLGFSDNFTLSSTAIAVMGLSAQTIEVISISLVIEIFTNSSPALIPLLLSGMGVGSILSGLVVAPFLSQAALKYTLMSSRQTSYVNEVHKHLVDSHYWVPFLIFALHGSLVGIGLLMRFCHVRYQNNVAKRPLENHANTIETESSKLILVEKPQVGYLVISCASIMLFLSLGILNLHANFLTNYVVDSLGVGTELPAYMGSCLQSMLVFSRLIHSAVCRKVGTSAPFFAAVLLFFISNVLHLCLPMTMPFMWMFVCLQGFSHAPIFPLTFSWLQEKYVLTTWTTPLALMVGIFGHAIFGILSSGTIYQFGPLSIRVILIVTSVFYIVNLTVMEISFRKSARKLLTK